MKKSKHIFMAVLFPLLSGVTSYAQTFEWAESFGGIENESTNSVTTDAAGNVYTAGSFRGTVDFDPGTGVYNLSSNGSYDCFIQKLDASGNFVWAKAFGGTSGDEVHSVTTDATGNVYTVGYFMSTVDFDPGAGVHNLPTNGSRDCFIQKLDASGNFVWAKAFGGTIDDVAYSVTTDATGNVYTVGYFRNTVDFDPGTGTHNLTFNGVYDIFIQKLDASGDFVWAKAFGAADNDKATSVSTDIVGNVYTAGFFMSTVDFDPGIGTHNLTSNGSRDCFVQKLDASGNFVWAKAFGGTGSDRITSISIDTSNNVYSVGHFTNTVDFDPGTGTENHTANGYRSCFVQKLDVSGDFVWAKTFGSTGGDHAYSVRTDVAGNVYTVGFFQNTVDFDPGIGTQNHTSNGNDDCFIQKLDASGNFVWAETFGGTGYDYAYSVTTDATGNVYTVGDFQNTVDFNSGAGVHNLTSNGGVDCFVQKLSQCSPNTGTETYTGCQGDGYSVTVNGTTYHEANPAGTETLTNVGGCDSVVTVNLVFNAIDITTSVSGLTITADSTSSTYQWINCSNNSAIAGETGQSFTATANGDYAVIVTDGSCTDTSACVTINSVGIEENTLSFSMHPNPTTGTVEIQSDTKIDKIEIINNLGQKVGEFKQSQFDISELKNGIYFVKVTTEIGTTTKRLIKQ